MTDDDDNESLEATGTVASRLSREYRTLFVWVPGHGERASVRSERMVYFSFPFRPACGPIRFGWDGDRGDTLIGLHHEQAAAPIATFQYKPKEGSLSRPFLIGPATETVPYGSNKVAYKKGPSRWEAVAKRRPLPGVAYRLLNLLMDWGEEDPILVKNYPLRADSYREGMVALMRAGAAG